MSPGSEEEEWMEWQQQQLQLASTPAAPDACVTPMLTRQELRDLGMSQDEDGRLSVQRTGRSSSKGKQAAAAAAAAAGMKSDPRTILQALAALIRVRLVWFEEN